MDDDLPPWERQLLESLSHHCLIRASHELCLRRQALNRSAMDLFIESLGHLLRTMAAQEVVARVAHDGEQPSTRVAAPEATEESERTHEGVLDDVFRVLIAAREPSREVVGRVQVRQHRLLEWTAGHRLLFPTRSVAQRGISGGLPPSGISEGEKRHDIENLDRSTLESTPLSTACDNLDPPDGRQRVLV